MRIASFKLSAHIRFHQRLKAIPQSGESKFQRRAFVLEYNVCASLRESVAEGFE